MYNSHHLDIIQALEVVSMYCVHIFIIYIYIYTLYILVHIHVSCLPSTSVHHLHGPMASPPDPLSWQANEVRRRHPPDDKDDMKRFTHPSFATPTVAVGVRKSKFTKGGDREHVIFLGPHGR